MKNIFGTPSDVIPFYMVDDSSVNPNHLPGSKVKPENRLIYYHRKLSHQLLSGPHLVKLAERYMSTLEREFSEGTIGSAWEKLPDLYLFLRSKVFRGSAVEAMFGTYIFSLTLTFAEEFWAFDRCVPYLARGLPRWMCPKSNKAR